MYEVYREWLETLFSQKELYAREWIAKPFQVELVFWILVLFVAAVLWLTKPRWLSSLESRFSRLSRRRMISVFMVGFAALALRAALLPWIPVPQPWAHDEYSYILQARTFDLGRLTNPTPPLWEHFETFHVNMVPTYQSMYPAGQAGFMLIGLLLGGNPWLGVWLSIGLMCATVFWMLQGWMPPQWALLGGVLCVLRFAVFGTWVNSYYGGAVAALGGALVLGALPRIKKRRQTVLPSVVFAVGLMILANTRPYEGLILSIVPGISLLVWLIGEGRPKLVSVLGPGLAVIVPVAAWMSYYNHVVVKDAFTLPYVVNQERYHVSRPFLWQSSYPLHSYDHEAMRKFYMFHEMPDYMRSRTWEGLVDLTENKFSVYYGYYFWPLAIGMLPAAMIARSSRKLRLLVATALLLTAGLLVESWMPQGHYASPGACVAIALLLLTLRYARTIRFKGMGVALSRAMLACLLALLVGLGFYTAYNPWHFTVDEDYSFPIERARVSSELARMPGRQMVLVRSHEEDNVAVDWVYNRPDLENAKVIWARDMGPVENQKLLQRFPGRQVFLIEPHDQFQILRPYRSSAEVHIAGGIIYDQRAAAHAR